jgi:beta-mannosidase
MTRINTTMAKPSKSQPLTSGWSFKQSDTDEWLSVKRVPTNVHLDLLDHEKYHIPLIQ